MRTNNKTIYRTENIQRFFKDINSKKYNPIDDEIIRKMFFNREQYKDIIINSNIRLVVTIAKNYDNEDNILDYSQEGIEGLMEAFEKYDPAQPAKFSTYASFWIKAKMSLLCKELNLFQKTNQGKIGSKAVKFQEQFLKENQREATSDEIREFLSTYCDVETQYDEDIYGYTVTSIDEEFDDDLTPETSGVFAVSTASENDYNKKVEREDMADAIQRMMTEVLSERERECVIRHIYNNDTFETIADEIGLTSERVRQIIVGSLKKMKNSKYAKVKFACFL